MTIRIQTVPTGLDPALTAWLQRVRDWIETRDGLRGEDGRFLVAADLVGNWQSPELLDSWTRYAETHEAPAFCLVADKMVVIKGTVAGGSVGATARVFVLPPGYRPAYRLVLPTVTNTGIGEINIEPTGEVRPVSGGTTWFSINSVFRAV